MNGVCNNIPGCIQPYMYSGVVICSLCNSSEFNTQPYKGVCVCLDGELVNDICNNMTGCITPYFDANGTKKCSYCNISAYFQG